ncbi:MAG: endonuclease/exonuclease/phosphatase family protein [Myxococcota bacterium]
MAMKAPRKLSGCPEQFAIPWPFPIGWRPFDWEYGTAGIPCPGLTWPSGISIPLPAGYTLPLPPNPFGINCQPGTHPQSSALEIRWGAEDFAERIIKSGYDIIVINEVWWSDAEDILRDELRSVYPYYIQRLNEQWPIEGSGLNIFSKLPFVPVPDSLATVSNGIPYYFGTARLGFDGTELDCDSAYYPGSKCVTHFSFWQYTESDSGDSWAQKGVGYVRVQNVDTGRLHNVFFTHMQASYSDQHDPANNFWSGLSERESQFDEIKDMINDGYHGNGAIIPGEDIFILGDFNVDGDISNPDYGFGAPTTPYENNRYEWRTIFKKGGATAGQAHGKFFNTVVHDTWAYEHPSFDTDKDPNAETEFGYTGGFNKLPVRLDYILSNVAFASDDALCNQHPHLAYNLLSGEPLFPGHGATPPGGRDDRADGKQGAQPHLFQSDHIGVNANYNALAPHCSPLLADSAEDLYGHKDYGAYELSEDDVGVKTDGTNNPDDTGNMQNGVLEHPGSVQWYYLKWDGAYLIGLDQASRDLGYQVQVYRSRNLSRPVKPYGDTPYEQEVQDGWDPNGVVPVPLYETIYGPKYRLEDGPFYIKVFHPLHHHRDVAGNTDGTYKLGVDALGCTDKTNDSCPIYPNVVYDEYKMPAGDFTSSPTMNAMYFDLAVERPTKPQDQRVLFDVMGYPTNVLASAIVENAPASDAVRVIDGSPLEQDGVLGAGTNASTCPGSNCELRIDTNVNSPTGESDRYLLRVARGHGVGAVDFDVVWYTELTVAFGGGYWDGLDDMRLICVDTTSDAGKHDEIEIEVRVDGELIGWPTQSRYDVGRFGETDYRSLDQVNSWLGAPWRYTEEIRWTMYETDLHNTANQVDFSLGPVPLFDVGEFSAVRRNDFDIYFDSGHYTTKVAGNHGLQSHSAD